MHPSSKIHRREFLLALGATAGLAAVESRAVPATAKSWRSLLLSGGWQPISFSIGNRKARLQSVGCKESLESGQFTTTVEFRDEIEPLTASLTLESGVGDDCYRLALKLRAEKRANSEIRDISILNLPIERSTGLEATYLYGITGGFAEMTTEPNGEKAPLVRFGKMPPAALQPWLRRLCIGQSFEIDSDRSGRSSNSQIPLWLYGDPGGGYWFGPEWSGCWRMRVARDARGSILQLGLPSFQFMMREGEELQLPAASFGGYRGDLSQGQNRLRSIILTRFVPRNENRRPTPKVTYQGFAGLPKYQTEEVLYAEVDRAAEMGCEAFVLDAGWNYSPMTNDWMGSVGTWEPDAQRFPRGFGRFAEHVHDKGMKLGLWIEPRAAVSSSTYKQNPDLFLLPTRSALFSAAKFAAQSIAEQDRKVVQPESLLSAVANANENRGLLDLSQENARTLLLEQMERLLSLGADWIWFDFNIDPRIVIWDAHEEADRKGLLELGFYQGLYTVFDTFLKRHPSAWLETCASGGRTIDLAMLRRSHSIWVCDTGSDDDVNRNLRSGANTLLPASTIQIAFFLNEKIIRDRPTGAAELGGIHRLLSSFGGVLQFGQGLCFWNANDLREARRYVDKYKEYRRYLEKDYFHLLPIPADRSCWDAWQYHDAETDSGILLIFRMAGNTEHQKGILPRATSHPGKYCWSTVLGDAAIINDEHGMAITMSAPSAALVHYSRT